MRLKISKSKHAQSLYVIRHLCQWQTFFQSGRKLGTYDELKNYTWIPLQAKEYINH